MKIVSAYMTKNPYYTKNVNKVNSTYTNFQVNGPRGLMLHSVGTPQPNASVFIKAWNNPSYKRACVHGFIQADGTVYQTLPWNYRAAHGGKDYSNHYYIGVEMCEPNTIKYKGSGATFVDNNPTATKTHVLGTYNTAVELFAMLCNKFNLNPLKDGVILSHREGALRGIASNHGDPEHLWSKFGLTMDKFRKDVNAKMKNISTSTNESTSNSSGEFLVKVTINDLNIRTGPSANTASKGYIKPGVYTIIETDGNWGRLKSKVGWIHLGYTTRI